MEKICVSCRKAESKSKIDSQCGVCGEGVCRKCRQFLSEDEFPWVKKRPAELSHTYYCTHCFDEHVTPFQARYEELAAFAKQVNVIYKGSKSLMRVLRKADKPIEVKDVADRDQAILILAYQAASEGFNSLLDVEMTSRKIRNEGYQTSSWSGRGVPAEIKSHETDR